MLLYLYILRPFSFFLQEKEKLQKENGQLKQSLKMTLERSGESHGSMSIMKQSLTQIKERLEKKERQYKNLEKQMKVREVTH